MKHFCETVTYWHNFWCYFSLKRSWFILLLQRAVTDFHSSWIYFNPAWLETDIVVTSETPDISIQPFVLLVTWCSGLLLSCFNTKQKSRPQWLNISVINDTCDIFDGALLLYIKLMTNVTQLAFVNIISSVFNDSVFILIHDAKWTSKAL